jgi:hypothetical protein
MLKRTAKKGFKFQVNKKEIPHFGISNFGLWTIFGVAGNPDE